MVSYALTIHALDEDMFMYRCVSPGNIPVLLIDDRDDDYTAVMQCDYDRPGALSLDLASLPVSMVTRTNEVWEYDVKFWSIMVVRKVIAQV